MSNTPNNTLFELGAGDLQTLLTTEVASTVDVVSACLQRIADRGEARCIYPRSVSLKQSYVPPSSPPSYSIDPPLHADAQTQ